MKVTSVKIADLSEDPVNARKHDDKNLDAIKGSLRRFGQQKPIVVDKKGVVIAGNGTLRAAKALGWEKIAVVYTKLDVTDATAFALADNRTAELASWDEEILGKTLQSLRELDFELTDIGFDTSYLDDLLKDADETAPDDGGLYTKKIEAPVYEPKGEKPQLDSLVDCSKTDSLLKEISKAIIPDEIKEFLRLAAARHNVFNYERIAEYYAHASADVQDLMERSALVIIDFDKAIEYGFVSLSEKLAEAYRNEQS